jgi:hypothetical protein
MVLWILQMLLNIVLGYFAFMWLISKKRIFWLEAQVEMLAQSLDQLSKKQSSASTPAAAENPIQTQNQKSTSQDRGQLIEKFMQNDPRKNLRPNADAYDRADQLLSRGVDLKEVAKQTGLSMAELQLMGKVSARVQ